MWQLTCAGRTVNCFYAVSAKPVLPRAILFPPLSLISRLFLLQSSPGVKKLELTFVSLNPQTHLTPAHPRSSNSTFRRPPTCLSGLPLSSARHAHHPSPVSFPARGRRTAYSLWRMDSKSGRRPESSTSLSFGARRQSKMALMRRRAIYGVMS